jgi:hypothetical protein
MDVNVESLLFTMYHDLEENVEGENISNPTIPLMNVVKNTWMQMLKHQYHHLYMEQQQRKKYI